MKEILQKIDQKIKQKSEKFLPIKFPPKTELLSLQIIAISVATIALLVAGFLSYSLAYQGKIYPHIKIYDENISGNSKSQVKEKLAQINDQLVEEQIEMKLDNQIFRPKLKDIGVSFNTSKAIEGAFSLGRSPSDWFKIKDRTISLFKKREIEFEPQVNQAILDKYFADLAVKIYIAPENAQIIFEDGTAKEVPAKIGQSLALDEAKEQIVQKIKNQDKSTVILTVKKTNPEILDEIVKETMPEAERAAALNYSFIAQLPRGGTKKLFASSKVVTTWLSFVPKDGQLTLSLNDSEVLAYIKKISRTIDVSPIDTQITIQNGVKKILLQGTPGLIMDRQIVYSSLKKALSRIESTTIQIPITEKPPSEVEVGVAQGGRFPGKYVEIVLSSRTLYCFEGMNQVCAFKISPGRPNLPTPYGLFSVIQKAPSVRCKPSPEYRTCIMPYTLKFTSEGHSIHELPIIDGRREGVSSLGLAVSHGCVRLGIGPAAQIYNWGELGMPVYIHR